MTPEEAKKGIATDLCLRYLNLHKATRRRDLIVKFKDPQFLSQMEQESLLRSLDNRDTYLPTVGSFALIADAGVLEGARLGTVRTIHTLKNLFEVHEMEEPYMFADLKAHASEIFDDPLDEKLMRLGLYLSADFGAIASVGRSADQFDITSFTIPEHILSLEVPEVLWEDRMRVSRNTAKGFPINIFGLSEEALPADPIRSTIEGTKEWYFQESARLEQKTQRCPFATPDLCPRYYQSVSLSGELGATEMDDSELERLREKWSKVPPLFVLREQTPSVQRGNKEFSSLDNFCPEVTYDLRGLFASMLGRYTDDIDRDMAQRRLAKNDAPLEDPAWSWGFIVPMHYTSCPTYSLLAGGDSASQTPNYALLEALVALPGSNREQLTQQVKRLDLKDPALAVGTAKEILETCCKTILNHLGGPVESSQKLPTLLKMTIKALQNSKYLPEPTTDSSKMFTRSLSALVACIAELRNTHGTGHGQALGSGSIDANHASLAVGSASVLCVYLAACLRHDANLP